MVVKPDFPFLVWESSWRCSCRHLRQVLSSRICSYWSWWIHWCSAVLLSLASASLLDASPRQLWRTCSLSLRSSSASRLHDGFFTPPRKCICSAVPCFSAQAFRSYRLRSKWVPSGIRSQASRPFPRSKGLHLDFSPTYVYCISRCSLQFWPPGCDSYLPTSFWWR